MQTMKSRPWKAVLPLWAMLWGLALLLGGCGEKTDELLLVSTEKEATRVLVELEGQGIFGAEKAARVQQRQTMWAVTVPRSRLSAARQVLVRFDLPHDESGGFAAMVGQAGLIPTRSDERAKLMYAMASELERTFEVYEHVLKARVHIVLPDHDPLERTSATQPAGSAMVLIKYKGRTAKAASGAASAPESAAYADAPVGSAEVKQMVARSIEGLTPNDVTVAYERVGDLSGSMDLATANSELTRKMREQQDTVLGLTVVCCLLAGAAGGTIVMYLRLRWRSGQIRMPAANS